MTAISSANTLSSGSNTFDVTSFVQSLVSGGASYAGFDLYANAIQADNFTGGSATNGNLGTNSPTLTVTYADAAATPEPSTLVLAATAGAMMVAGRMRRGRKQAVA